MILTGAVGSAAAQGGTDLPVSSVNLLRGKKLQMQQELNTYSQNNRITPMEEERQRFLQVELSHIEEQILALNLEKRAPIIEETEEAAPQRDASRNPASQAVAGTAAALQQVRAEQSGQRRDQPQELQLSVAQLEKMAAGPPITRGEPRTGGSFDNGAGEKGGSGAGYGHDEKKQGRNFDKTV